MDLTKPQIGLEKKGIKELFKALDIKTRNLKSYDVLYGTTPYTFTYGESSMWLFTYNPRTGAIEYNTTYLEPTQKHLNYNKICNLVDTQKQWERVKPKLSTLNQYERAAWLDIQKQYNLK